MMRQSTTRAIALAGRWPMVEAQARYIASTALAATYGRMPGRMFEPYVTPQVLHRLQCRARLRKARRALEPCMARTYLCQVAPDVFEATVVIHPKRPEPAPARGVAVRLERYGTNYRATELVMITPGGGN
jgi:hypothetical protein